MLLDGWVLPDDRYRWCCRRDESACRPVPGCCRCGEASQGDPVGWVLPDGLAPPGVEARRCPQDGGGRVYRPVQAGEWGVRVRRVSRERRHGLEHRAETGHLRG